MEKNDTERELVDAAQRGDRASLERLTERYHGRLRKLVDFRLGPSLRSVADVDDVLQETFLRACDSIDRFSWRSPDSFFHWLSAITRNVILEVAKKNKHRAEPLGREPQASDVSPSRGLRRDERFQRLSAALEKLSPDYRQVLRLVLQEKLPQTEVARRMGRTPPTATARRS